jgi:glycosyltransferase involved in cell wall biosynthesis
MTAASRHSSPRYSFVIPTYKRPDLLTGCLESLAVLDYPLEQIEIVIVDNGGSQNSRGAAEPFMSRLPIRYFVNARNRGLGFSMNRGFVESRGDRIVSMNDDARPRPDLLRECDRLMDADPAIGCAGCRAIEEGHERWGSEIGRVLPGGLLIGNFDLDCGDPIEVEHVYGFCYVFTRAALERAGLNDLTLLAQPYSSGNRIETDHCLSIGRAGLKVVYNPRMVAQHLAKPRPDMSEASPRWHLNAIRNTIYLFLKHYGPFGKGAAALRLTFFQHVGIVSALRHPSKANVSYFLNGLRARASAYGHYIKYLAGPRFDSPEAFKRNLNDDVPASEAASLAGAAAQRSQ